MIIENEERRGLVIRLRSLRRIYKDVGTVDVETYLPYLHQGIKDRILILIQKILLLIIGII